MRVPVFDFGSIPSVPNLRLYVDWSRTGAYHAVWRCDCSECGAEFETESWRQDVCSEECRVARRRRLGADRSRRYRERRR